MCLERRLLHEVLLATNNNCWQDSIFLQQACHITDGVYWRVSHTQKALLQYFLVAACRIGARSEFIWCRPLSCLVGRLAVHCRFNSYALDCDSDTWFCWMDGQLPQPEKIDLRAMCFDRKEPVELANVCSVCLSSEYTCPVLRCITRCSAVSVFSKEMPNCATCGYDFAD